MKAGIVGLPNVGKSTLFNCLSNAKAQSANFPFCTIEPNIGVVNVPDERLVKLEELVVPEKVIPATVEIVDIAGLVKGASKGEGLGNQFLGNIRETDAILHVLRCFDNDNIIHVDGNVDPIRDKETIDIELQLKDLETVDKKLEKVKRSSRTGNKEAQKEDVVLIKIKNGLEQGVSLRAIEISDKDREEFVTSLQFITDKGTKVTARPSGTEPKIKFYFSVQDHLKSNSDFYKVQDKLQRKIIEIQNEMSLI